ncbi:hypothetical protein CHCC20333_4594 [Bacillus paralicheniformis]|nr:hypothetical protein CHCC20333_4594 [Bacillus paralicheniformis]
MGYVNRPFIRIQVTPFATLKKSRFPRRPETAFSLFYLAANFLVCIPLIMTEFF